MQIISREKAKKKGLKRFFTGIACSNGHKSERYVSTGACKDCLSDFKKRRRKKYLDQGLTVDGDPRFMRKKDTIYITRTEAIALGFKRYHTGFLCVHGHDSERYVSTGTCVVCELAKAKRPEYIERRREVARKAALKYSRKNPEKLREARSKWKAKNPTYASEYSRKYRLKNGSSSITKESNPEYHKRRMELQRKRRESFEYKARENARARERMKTPEVRARNIERCRKRRQMAHTEIT